MTALCARSNVLNDFAKHRAKLTNRRAQYKMVERKVTSRTSKSYPVRARARGEEAGPLRCFSRMLTRVCFTTIDDSDAWAGAVAL